MAETMMPPQIRKAKRKVLVTTTNHPENDRFFKKVKCDYMVVSKDIEEVEYYEDSGDDDGGGGGAKKKHTEEFCDEIYEDVQIYEENYGFPRQINGQIYYVDLSNFVFDFDSKELIGKLNSNNSSNIILFRQDMQLKKKKYTTTEIVKII